MLQRGDSVPHFEVRTLDGELFSYAAIWQRKNLLLVSLPTVDSESTRNYVTDLLSRVQEFGDQDVACVMTRDRIPGIPASGVLVADKWGEIIFAADTSDAPDLSSPQELIDWLHFVQQRCPECEGEAR